MHNHENIKEYYSHITKEQEGKMETGICSCALDGTPRSYSGHSRKRR